MTKISELLPIDGSVVNNNDLFVIVSHLSEGLKTQSITVEEAVQALQKVDFDNIRITGGYINPDRIILKHTTDPLETPTSDDLAFGELFFNLALSTVYYKDSDGVIKTLDNGGGIPPGVFEPYLGIPDTESVLFGYPNGDREWVDMDQYLDTYVDDYFDTNFDTYANNWYSTIDQTPALQVVNGNASGGGSLAYNSTTGVLTFTPPDLTNLGGTQNVSNFYGNILSSFMGDKLNTNDIILSFVAPKTMTLPANLVDSEFKITGAVPTTSNARVDFEVNGVNVGHIIFAQTTGVPTVTFPADVVLNDGDVLTLYNRYPTTSDGFSGVAFSILVSGDQLTPGVDLTAFSVETAPSASGGGALTYNNTTGVFTYTPSDVNSGGGSSGLGQEVFNVSAFVSEKLSTNDVMFTFNLPFSMKIPADFSGSSFYVMPGFGNAPTSTATVSVKSISTTTGSESLLGSVDFVGTTSPNLLQGTGSTGGVEVVLPASSILCFVNTYPSTSEGFRNVSFSIKLLKV